MSEDSASDLNLSEVLFKPRHDYIETSLISNSGCPLPDLGDGFHLMGSHFRALWYRPLNRFSWVYLGANCLDVDEALSHIVMSTNKRTREQCFDTVEQYGPGNWIYEFSNIAQRRIRQATQNEEEGDLVLASHNYRMASRYFAIASYPNLKGDTLAAQAALLGRRAYRKIFNDEKIYGHYAEETFTVDGNKITGFLHSVNNTDMQPCVIVMTSYGATSTDYYRLFSDYLRKLGIAIFVIDMPGMGASERLELNPHSGSDLLEAAIKHLKEHVPYVDSSALGAIGFHFGANAVVRLCVMHPEYFKAIATVSPALHSAFVDQDLLNSMSLAARSSLANRLNLDASSWETIVPQMQIMSLKKQGLLSFSSRLKTDCLSLFMPIDLKFNDDHELIDHTFTNNINIVFKKMRVAEIAPKIFYNISEFFRDKLL